MRDAARDEIRASAEQAFAAYERMLEQGVAKEVARTVLPLAMYTKYYWSCNPRSLMHFCSLRNSEHAQYEIREYAARRREFSREAHAGDARRLRGERENSPTRRAPLNAG